MPNRAKKALNDSNNSLCRAIGHNFRLTTSSTYRVCGRSHCGAAQRLHNGAWIDVQPRHKQEKYHEPQAVLSFWQETGVQL